MKIRKIGRERPVLYRGRFDVPSSIVSRLAISQNHLVLAGTTSFNAKVDQYYLAIDNVLSAVIMAKEGTLSTTDHRKKIVKFFKHLGRRARIRSISKDDFVRFYSVWSNSRYRLYFPSSLEIYEMELFTWHLYDFAITEIARFFKSDETILSDYVSKLLDIHESEAILEESGRIHEIHQIELESLGEAYGGKLELKLLNPWNYIRISLISDRKEVISSIDSSKEIHDLLKELLKLWDRLISKIVWKNIERIGLGIANAKLRKKKVAEKQAIEEAIEETRKHPDILKFRLALNLSYNSMGAKEELTRWAKIIATSIRHDEHPNKAYKSGWETYRAR